jgi:putative hydrolase of the HAD superfamily
MVKNVIFDMGGVLVDVHRERAIESFKSIGVADADQLIDSYHHEGLFLDLENGDIDTKEFCTLLSQHAGREIVLQDIAKAWRSIVSDPPVYKLDYLIELRKEYTLFVLSNNNPILVDGWASTPQFSTQGRPVMDYFDKLYLSYQMKCTKPAPIIFEKMIDDSQIIPAESLFIDDGLHNIETAQSLGFHTYHAQNGEDWREALDQLLGRKK